MTHHFLYRKSRQFTAYIRFTPETLEVQWVNISGQEMQHLVYYEERYCREIFNRSARIFYVDNIEEMRALYKLIEARGNFNRDKLIDCAVRRYSPKNCDAMCDHS